MIIFEVKELVSSAVDGDDDIFFLVSIVYVYRLCLCLCLCLCLSFMFMFMFMFSRGNEL